MNRSTRWGRAALGLALLLGAGSARAEDGRSDAGQGAPPGNAPHALDVREAEARVEDGVLVIRGSNFPDPPHAAAPSVRLGGVPLAVLTYSATEVTAALPAVIPATYRVAVSRGGGVPDNGLDRRDDRHRWPAGAAGTDGARRAAGGARSQGRQGRQGRRGGKG